MTDVLNAVADLVLTARPRVRGPQVREPQVREPQVRESPRSARAPGPREPQVDGPRVGRTRCSIPPGSAAPDAVLVSDDHHRYEEAQRLYNAACAPRTRATVLIDNADYAEPRLLRP